MENGGPRKAGRSPLHHRNRYGEFYRADGEEILRRAQADVLRLLPNPSVGGSVPPLVSSILWPRNESFESVRIRRLPN